MPDWIFSQEKADLANLERGIPVLDSFERTSGAGKSRAADEIEPVPSLT
jgi:hypothetical protein